MSRAARIARGASRAFADGMPYFEAQLVVPTTAAMTDVGAAAVSTASYACRAREQTSRAGGDQTDMTLERQPRRWLVHGLSVRPAAGHQLVVDGETRVVVGTPSDVSLGTRELWEVYA